MNPSKTPKPPRGKRPVKKTDDAQSKRFVETAKEIGADESPKNFDRAFARVAKPKHGNGKS